MQRAVIAIGVKKTGQLPELQAAVESATAFAAWARGDQKIAASRVKLITDARGAVSRDRIFDAVERVTKLGFIEQLIVYFCGHGINSGLYEQWLLSRAPDDPGAAVNLKGSEFGARFCGVGHVIFISDACRTAADSIQAQRVSGGEIFPNVSPTGPEKPVDQFFATLVGNPAYEVKSVEESAGRFCAAYSQVLLEALKGEAASLLEPSEGHALIRPRPLKRHLATAVPSYLASLELPSGISQQPDARIESEPEAWIAEVALELEGGRAAAKSRRKRATRSTTAPNLEAAAARHLRAALDPGDTTRRSRSAARKGRGAAGEAPTEAEARFQATLAREDAAFGADHFESRCGIRLRGARTAEVFASGATVASGGAGAGVERVEVTPRTDRRGANVFVRLDDGSAVVVPALRDFVTTLSFDGDGSLDDVWFEPAAGSARWQEYERNAADIRKLRAVVAAASSLGVFRLEEEGEGEALLEHLRRVKSLDPALAVYAAHAFHDRRMRSHVVDMQRHLDRELHVRIFDVAMLAFSMGKPSTRDEPQELYPLVPMLTQAWPLLSPLGITLPGSLEQRQGELRAAVWTHFLPSAADHVLNVLKTGEVE